MPDGMLRRVYLQPLEQRKAEAHKTAAQLDYAIDVGVSLWPIQQIPDLIGIIYAYKFAKPTSRRQ
jgi:hypothetical protein